MHKPELAETTAAGAAPQQPDIRPSQFGLGILRGMQTKHVYGGTADPAKVARNRARNRAARKSRRTLRAS